MSRKEDECLIERMGKLLAEIAVIVNGPEPPLTRWSYHDLPEKVRALKQAQQPAALAVPAEADAEALDFARKASRLLYGFMLDTNAIGPKEAGVNLARSIKAMLAAAERNGVGNG